MILPRLAAGLSSLGRATLRLQDRQTLEAAQRFHHVQLLAPKKTLQTSSSTQIIVLDGFEPSRVFKKMADAAHHEYLSRYYQQTLEGGPVGCMGFAYCDEGRPCQAR